MKPREIIAVFLSLGMVLGTGGPAAAQVKAVAVTPAYGNVMPVLGGQPPQPGSLPPPGGPSIGGQTLPGLPALLPAPSRPSLSLDRAAEGRSSGSRPGAAAAPLAKSQLIIGRAAAAAPALGLESWAAEPSARTQARLAAASLGGLAERISQPPADSGDPKAGVEIERFYSGVARRDAEDAPVLAGDPTSRLVGENEGFLNEIQRRAFRFFWENTDPKSGLTKDRAGNFGGADGHRAASIASTGFALTALGIGHERGWISRDQAYQRALTALRYFRDELPNVHGWFHHFLDITTGLPMPGSEVSSIDTALVLAGMMFIGRHFPGTEVEKIAEDVYRRVDFPWMMTDGGAKPEERTLSMGWTPEGGFIKARWREYSEHMLLLVLGMASPTHPLGPEVWDAWSRPRGTYGGHTSIASGPLFTHQYSHAFIDFRDIRDRYADYFDSSVQATLSNRRFAIDQMGEHKTYGPDSWGLTASDGPDGYRAYGAPPGRVEHDGTVAPAAAGGSIVFAPGLAVRALRFFKETFGKKIWGRYGFADAFNTDLRWKFRFNADGMWRSPDVIGIDQGIMLLMIENLRSGLIWNTIMGSAHIQKGLEKAGFVGKEGRTPVR